MVKKIIKKQSSNAVLLTNTIIFHKNVGFKSLVEIQKIFCKTKLTIQRPEKLIRSLSCFKNAEDRLYNATIIETIECILITINSKRRDFSFAKY